MSEANPNTIRFWWPDPLGFASLTPTYGLAANAREPIIRVPDYTANDVPHPQVAVAFGLRMVKAAAIRSST
ncbi:hypothetical protein SAMN05421720_1167 [Rhodospira trueperi]|uniref:Uncharacterized protein n=1 Tax=Rhodospira trueperi TaxID=69960 RepID=A0A1G7GUJ1_9PROT|nr:hypothetical protein SAMN05421720_1167 [Rhodospira trueperi]